MRYGSVCSGIEAASVAWHPLGWEADWLAEIEPFPAAVLNHHYPDVENLGDMTRIAAKVLSMEIEAPDVLVGGTPCQAFSVAGLRNSLDDDRGQLSIAYIHIADAIDAVRRIRGEEPAIVVWENVPGVLSTKDNAFGCFLAGLAGEDGELVPAGKKWTDAGCVYGPERTVAWRILDAQYFGVAQRRRRVFVVASARAGFDPAAVLFEREGLRRDYPPRRSKGEEVAGTVAEGSTVGSLCARDIKGVGSQYVNEGKVIPTLNPIDVEVTGALTAGFGKMGAPEVDAYTCIPVAFHPTGGNQGGDFVVQSTYSTPAIGSIKLDDVSSCISRNTGAGGETQNPAFVVGQSMQVRRLTPEECEALQGFPRSYTNIPWRGNSESPDGPRYKALGNSMAVPVMHWIGKRIDMHVKRKGENNG